MDGVYDTERERRREVVIEQWEGRWIERVRYSRWLEGRKRQMDGATVSEFVCVCNSVELLYRSMEVEQGANPANLIQS